MKSGIWIALAAALGLTVLWDSPMILPFKLLVVLIHEMWHGLASLVFGARVERIVLHPGETGETLVTGLRGGWAVALSVSAGYLGSALTGGILLRRGLVESFERTALAVFAGVALYMTALYCAPGSLAFTTGIGWALGLLFACALGERYARVAVLIVGTMFLWYSFFDLFDFTRDVKRTDAGILARFLKSRTDLSLGVAGFSTAISLVWTGMILAMLYYLLGSIVIHAAPRAAAPEQDPSLLTPLPPLNAAQPALAQPAALTPAGPPPAMQNPAAPAAPVPAAPAAIAPPAPRNDLDELLALRDELQQR